MARAPEGGPTLQRRLVFLHVPKCGGSSVNTAIRASCSPEVRRSRDARYVRLDTPALRRTARRLGKPVRNLSQKLLFYALARDATQVVAGHYRHLDAAFAEFGERFAFTTLLRDPVDQLLSLYFFDLNGPDEDVRIELPLPEWLETPAARERGRAYVDWFRGDAPWEGDGAVAIEAACNNLSRYALVGALEHIDKFAAGYKRLFGVPLDFPHINVNPVPRDEQQRVVTDTVRARVEQLVRPNRAVYDFVVQGLGARV